MSGFAVVAHMSTVLIGDHRVERERLTIDCCISTRRALASTAHGLYECAFGSDCRDRFWILYFLQKLEQVSIVGACLDREYALAGGGNECIGGKIFGNDVEPAKPREASGC